MTDIDRLLHRAAEIIARAQTATSFYPLLQKDMNLFNEEYKALNAEGISHITVGGGLSVCGTWEAIKRVQHYILLDSTHPVEKSDVRRVLMKELEEAEQKILYLQGEVNRLSVNCETWKQQALEARDDASRLRHPSEGS